MILLLYIHKFLKNAALKGRNLFLSQFKEPAANIQSVTDCWRQRGSNERRCSGADVVGHVVYMVFGLKLGISTSAAHVQTVMFETSQNPETFRGPKSPDHIISGCKVRLITGLLETCTKLNESDSPPCCSPDLCVKIWFQHLNYFSLYL